MQVDQFESEVESLSVQTRKKKGDKEVSLSVLIVTFLVVHALSFVVKMFSVLQSKPTLKLSLEFTRLSSVRHVETRSY